MKNIAIIVAAGNGSRMGLDKPKQFLVIKNKPILVYTLEAFNNHKDISNIVVVTSEEYINEVKNLAKQHQINKIRFIIKGGETRQQSVYAGLNTLKENGYSDDDIVLIHDAARPLVSEDIITSNIKACRQYDAVDTVIGATDTIILSKDSEVINETTNRNELYQVQTPQTFKLGLILKAHESCEDPSVTDDAQLVQKLGKKVHLVQGNKKNFKVTTSEDLKILEAFLDD